MPVRCETIPATSSRVTSSIRCARLDSACLLTSSCSRSRSAAGMLIRAIAHRMLQLLRESALFFFQTRIYRAAGQPDGGCRLVEQINRLVRQKPVCQIPAGKLHRRLHRLVRNADAVVLLKPRTKPLQNAQRLAPSSARAPAPAGTGAPALHPFQCTFDTPPASSRR